MRKTLNPTGVDQPACEKSTDAYFCFTSAVAAANFEQQIVQFFALWFSRSLSTATKKESYVTNYSSLITRSRTRSA